MKRKEIAQKAQNETRASSGCQSGQGVYQIGKASDIQGLQRKMYHAEALVVGSYQAGVCAFEGVRGGMEDTHLIEEFTIQIGGQEHAIQLFGVFDGHGGVAAANFLRDNLRQELQTQLVQKCSERLSEEGIWHALKETFPLLHKEFINSTTWNSGSTAIIAMVLDGRLWVANVGDSTAFLDDGTALSDPAKPQVGEYKKGIEKNKGCVGFSDGVHRLNHVLGTGRAIGDRRVGPGLISKPKIVSMPIQDITKGTCLILACDGATEVAAEREYAAGIREHKGSVSIAQLAEGIVYSAVRAGSRDNVSVIVVQL